MSLPRSYCYLDINFISLCINLQIHNSQDWVFDIATSTNLCLHYLLKFVLIWARQLSFFQTPNPVCYGMNVSWGSTKYHEPLSLCICKWSIPGTWEKRSKENSLFQAPRGKKAQTQGRGTENNEDRQGDLVEPITSAIRCVAMLGVYIYQCKSSSQVFPLFFLEICQSYSRVASLVLFPW